MKKPLLKETAAPQFSNMIVEKVETPVGTRLKVRGVYSSINRTNENHRRYSKRVWEKNLAPGSPFQRLIENKMAFGELEHPESGQTHLARVSHLITKTWIENLPADNPYGVEAGEWVLGEALILNTPNGLILQEIYAVGGRPGVSSRGRGDVETATDGVDEVQENYDCETFDFVTRPSVIQALPLPTEYFEQNRSNLKVESVLSEAANIGTLKLLSLIELGGRLSTVYERTQGEEKNKVRQAVTKIVERIRQLRNDAGILLQENKQPKKAVTENGKGNVVKNKPKKVNENVIAIVEELSSRIAVLEAENKRLLNDSSKATLALQQRYDKLVQASDILLQRARQFKAESLKTSQERDKAIELGEKIRQQALKFQEEINVLRRKRSSTTESRKPKALTEKQKKILRDRINERIKAGKPGLKEGQPSTAQPAAPKHTASKPQIIDPAARTAGSKGIAVEESAQMTLIGLVGRRVDG